MDALRILFMGTPDFAVFSLKQLVESGENVIGVLTQPDQPKGRGYVLTPSPVKVYALEHNIPVYQPATLKSPEFMELLQTLNPDLGVVAAYGKILPAAVLDYPKYGCINLHGSLLPKYRGAAPMQRAIMDGEEYTGMTVMQMDAGLDTGDILLQKKVPIGGNDNFETVHDHMGVCGAELLAEYLVDLRAGNLHPQKQDGEKSTYASKIEKEECLLNWNKSASEIHNIIRGLSPIPLSYTFTPDGKRVKIFSATVGKKEGTCGVPGTVLSLENGVVTVACGSGTLQLTEILPEGKGRMSAAAWINGRKIHEGDRLGTV